MSKLKEIIGHDSHQKEKLKLTIPPSSLPLTEFDELYEITLVVENEKPYVFRILKDVSEPVLDPLIEYESLSINLSDIKDIFIKLNNDQRKFVMHVYYLYKNNKKISKQTDFGEIFGDNPKIILHGPAGTGKSTIINFIEKLITWEENKTSNSPQKLKVLKCAFTGKAASNIGGSTLNFTFSIPRYKSKNLSQTNLDHKRKSYEDCIFFICDEISMVGKITMSQVDTCLKKIFDNDKIYGDRFVLLVGDLYQIDPVKQRPIHPDSIFWKCCEFYELTEIKRQADQKFINALNNFRNCEMTHEDTQLLKSREIGNLNEVPDSVVHLFYLNKDVDDYNNKKLEKSKEKEEIVNKNENFLPSELCVKIGIRYMITYNIDVGDSLANGTTGVAKGFEYDKKGCVVIIWMEFHSDVIGKKTRSNYFKMLKKKEDKNWIPIKRSKNQLKLKDDPKKERYVENMFPLKAAEAITVHKSQGQTCHDGVCIHLTNDTYDKLRTNDSLLYVALTRVKQLNDLYILGTLEFNAINSKKFIRIKNELSQLRNERKLKLAYETFEDKTGDVIVYLNTGLTFNEHYEFITTDEWYRNASLLIFSETNTIASDQIEIPNFEIAFRSDNKTVLSSGGGIICYKEASKSMEVIYSILDDDNKIFLTLLLYEKVLYIITCVKGNLSDDDFQNAIKKFTKRIDKNRCIFFIGDFNIDPKKDFLDTLEFKKELSSDILTSKGESKCDLLYTKNLDIQQENIGFYQYIPSSHKPIYVVYTPES